jgi:hypothetical protein
VDYWILNAECSHALIIPGDIVAASKPKVVKNKYVPKGEKFYQIPVTLCVYIKLANPIGETNADRETGNMQ